MTNSDRRRNSPLAHGVVCFTSASLAKGMVECAVGMVKMDKRSGMRRV